ncbi:hypothetical protein AAF712_008010 [Marasmius tenuissimus]|uniref:Uncharacterized protein n=1 Tax=Marasmius tenuissimus TaxID=585030 RepID=A0ABR2ZVC6_9AGAR
MNERSTPKIEGGSVHGGGSKESQHAPTAVLLPTPAGSKCRTASFKGFDDFGLDFLVSPHKQLANTTGGCLWLKDPTVRDEDDEVQLDDDEQLQEEDQEETFSVAEGQKTSQVKNEDEGDEQEEEIHWPYTYFGFHMFKGEILRAIIQHLEGLLSLSSLRDAVKKASLSEEQSIRSAKAAVEEALKICQDWVRNPKGGNGHGTQQGLGSSRLLANDDMMQGWGMVLSGRPLLAESAMGLDSGFGGTEDMLDASYWVTKVEKTHCCPLPLHLAGIRGLYDLLGWYDNGQIVYSDEAKRVVDVMDKALVYLEPDPGERENIKEMARGMRKMMINCDGVKYVA